MAKLRPGFRAHFQQEGNAVEAAMRDLREGRVVQRIRRRDHTVWKPDPTEISNRLGWLNSPLAMLEAVAAIEGFVARTRRDGLQKALLLGMGGSSLAPEVFRQTFGVRDGYLDLSVLDSTDPAAVLECAAGHDPAVTLYIVSSKSGSTVETASFFKYFYNQAQQALGKEAASSRFAAITDPGSGLAEIGRELGFRQVFLNDPQVGGRFSALTYFGLVPAGLIGVDLLRLLERARKADQEGDDSAALLGAAMGELALHGRDKLTLLASSQLAPFGAWAEQLIAESTGKEGKGILPVDGEEIGPPEGYGDDRLFVCLKLDSDSTLDGTIKSLVGAGQPVVQLGLGDLYDLGGEFFRWELATAVAGSRLGINPFDQPNVESAKKQARRMVDEYREKGRLPNPPCALSEDGIEVYAQTPTAGSLSEALTDFLAQAEQESMPRPYVALQAYLQPADENTQALQALRRRIRERCNAAVTLGYGPRFLHSTGQLHKGDAGNGLFIQLTADMPQDADIPDEPGSDASSLSFGVLKTAQALGDQVALLEAGRKVIRFHFRGEVVKGLQDLANAADRASRQEARNAQ